MGLTDDLKDQAERIRSGGGRQSGEVRREAFYQSQLWPKMPQALDYLNELPGQLEGVARYRLPESSHLTSAVQGLRFEA